MSMELLGLRLLYPRARPGLDTKKNVSEFVLSRPVPVSRAGDNPITADIDNASNRITGVAESPRKTPLPSAKVRVITFRFLPISGEFALDIASQSR